MIRALTLLLLALTATSAAAAPFGWYFPLGPGMSWTYENADNPFHTQTFRVLGPVAYEGYDAWRYGVSLDAHNIIAVEQGTLTVLAEVDEGVTRDFAENAVLGEVVDGATFRICPDGATCDSTLIRVWTELDPTLRSLYDMDQGPQDLVLLASYDRGHPPNLHNAIVESNLPPGAVPPAGAVTFMEWYLRGVGLLEEREITAATGGMSDHMVLVATTDAEAVPISPALSSSPNPFNPRTTLRFELAEQGIVELDVYDAGGRRVRRLLDGVPLQSGPHAIVWNGSDDVGRALPSGAYLVRLGGGAPLRVTLLR